ncbi:hypothetical protein C1H46_013882 [Malus baccata]|uniref:Uncharacterized protein n=1 Tax=Malus baccata TaxID=106549 RepID=A0A540MNZ7_MALBA|nr:hypothetical protein C1H46_013882 [Malus baccata]
MFISELQKPLNLQLSLNWQTRKQIRGPQKVVMRPLSMETERTIAEQIRGILNHTQRSFF